MKENQVQAGVRWGVPVGLVLLAAVALSTGYAFEINSLQVTGIIAGVLGFLATLDAFGLIKDGFLGPRDSAEDRVKRLLGALAESTKVIGDIERAQSAVSTCRASSE